MLFSLVFFFYDLGVKIWRFFPTLLVNWSALLLPFAQLKKIFWYFFVTNHQIIQKASNISAPKMEAANRFSENGLYEEILEKQEQYRISQSTEIIALQQPHQ